MSRIISTVASKMILTGLTLWLMLLGNASWSSPIIVRQLNVEDGLSQSSVHEIFQDSYGFIWLATENGINRYDGHQINQFHQANRLTSQLNSQDKTLPDSQTGLPSGSNITSISEDKNRRVWIGSLQGLSVYDPVINSFTRLSVAGPQQTGLHSTNISSIIKHQDGTMWVGTYDGLHSYNYQQKSFTRHIIPSTMDDEANVILCLVQAPNGQIVIGTQKRGVLLYDPPSKTFSQLYYTDHKPNSASNEIRALFFDNREQLWIGTEQGLFRYDFNKQNISENILNKLELKAEARHRVRSITQDRSGLIWVAIYGTGIVAINPRNLERILYEYQPFIRHGLSSNSIRKLYFDKDGLLWIGTESYGVSIWNPTSLAFRHITHQSDSENSLSSNSVWVIFRDPIGNFWIGTDMGLNYYDSHTQVVTQMKIGSPNNPVLSSNLILGIALDNETNTLWLATPAGLNQYKLNSKENTVWQHSEDPQSLADDFIYDVMIDRQRRLWVATNSGLDRIDLNEGNDGKPLQIKHYVYDKDDDHSISKNTAITKLFEANNGEIWIGTDNGLNRYNEQQDNFSRFYYTIGGYNAESNSISTITEVKRGVIWIGLTGHGIIALDFSADQSKNKDNPTIVHIGIKDGLPTNVIFGMIPDHFGSVWISTMAGLVRYSLNSGNHKIFGAKQGLLDSEFNGGSYNVGDDGLLYFGSTNGMTIVNSTIVKPKNNNKPLTLSSATIYNDDHNTYHSLLGSKALTVEHNAYAIKINFSDLNYSAPKQSRFAYRFDSIGTSWIDIGNDNAITLNNLNAGRFTLSLKSKVQGGEWGKEQQLDILVKAPWWRTKFAYLFYILLISLIVYINHVLRRNRRLEKRQINRQLRLFAEAFKNTSEGVMIMHKSRTIVAVNAAFTVLTGYSEKEAIAAGTNIISSQKHSIDFYEHIWATLEEQRQWQGEVWQTNKQGQDIAMEMTISSVTNEEQQVSHYVAVFSDITERLNAEQELRKLAKYDALTGLPNRTLLQDRLEHAISHCRRERQQLAVLFLDLDRFKHVNDSLGHDIGDLLLIETANRISALLNDDDTFARLGGDEFVIIIEDFIDIKHVIHVCQQIILALGQSFSLTGYEVASGTSIGISIFPEDGDSSQSLLKNADTAMYHVKAQGRNNFQFYTQSMNVKAFERLNIENELRRAIQEQQFVLHYQPRVNSHDGRVTSLEALIRWQHPQKGFTPPGYFIDIAEDSGLIVPISQWVIEEACRQLSSWQKSGFTNVSLSVNLSPRLFSHFSLVEFIDRTLQTYQVPAGNLELEITESMLMNDVEATITELYRLNALGCHISVDDFGTGYSSLSYLHRFPVHTLKIDRSFVNAIHQHSKGKALVDIIINLAHNLDLALVAEGVETIEQFEFLRDKAQMQIQGFYFSKPVDNQAVMAILIKGFEVNEAADV